MIDLSVNYGRLKLKSPIIAGSSGLTENISTLLEFEEAGAGAIVLKSLFEEEIIREMSAELKTMNSESFLYPETLEFYDYYENQNDISTEYLNLIGKVKNKLKIPVIASINCVDSSYWTYFPKLISEAGADALELNVFILPADTTRSAAAIEKTYFDIISEIRKQVQLPIFVKLSYYSTQLAQFLQTLSKTGIDGLILFNRFFNPDIDLKTFEITNGAVLSSPTDYFQTLRWIAIMSGRCDCDIIASSGIHDSESVIKMLLAGASAVQMASAFYKNGISYLNQVLKGVEDWMKSQNYTSIADFQGKLSQKNINNPAAYSRIQFMKYYRGYTQ
jgi:dihydroorotate dehydrogenase (fumarate)